MKPPKKVTAVVEVGQVWQDNDKRSYGRRLLVKRIVDGYAYCVGWANGVEFNKSRIRLDRFRPNSTGYKLITPLSERGK